MRTPAEVYQPSARPFDERIKTRLYDLGTETRRVSEAGYVGWNGGICYVGESFAGAEVALEEDKRSGLVAVRYANVKLGSLDASPNARLRPPAYASPNARLRPPAYAERWESNPCRASK